jgi:hypothetical protein
MEFAVKILLTVCTVLMAGALAGCAGVSADVSARGALPDASEASVVYRLALSPAEAEAASSPPYEAMLREGLAARGFVTGDPDKAAYVVSVSWSTRPADVGISQGDCAPACEPAAGPSLPWFGRPYVHTLTLRFFALPSGAEAYRVSVVQHDRDADAQGSLPYLVAGALAPLPHAGAPQWRVKLRDLDAGGEGSAGALPQVISVKAAAPAQ